MSRKPAPTSSASSAAPGASWNLEEIDDETAWLRAVPPAASASSSNGEHPQEPLGELLRRLDRQLRCELCRDLLKFPTKIVTCGHTFCSECVRTHLQVQQTNNLVRDCPACRVPLHTSTNLMSYEKFLQPNRDLQNIAETFQSLRAPLLQALRAAGDSSTVAAVATAEPLTDGDPRTTNRRRGRGRRKRDEDYDDDESNVDPFHETGAKKPKAESPDRKPLARKKLPIKFRALKEKDLKKLCREMGVEVGGGETGMRNRLERFRTYWNARCQNESEQQIRKGFDLQERAAAAAAQRDNDQNGASNVSDLVMTMIKHRNDGIKGPAKSGDPLFDQKWHGGFASLKEHLKQRKAREKALEEEKLKADQLTAAAAAAAAADRESSASQAPIQLEPHEDPAERGQQNPDGSMDEVLLDQGATCGTAAVEGLPSESPPSAAHANESSSNLPALVASDASKQDSSVDSGLTSMLPGNEAHVADSTGALRGEEQPVNDQLANRAEAAGDNHSEVVRGPPSPTRDTGPTLSVSSSANRAGRASASSAADLPSMFVDLTGDGELTGPDENRHPDRSSSAASTTPAPGRIPRARNGRKSDDTQSSCVTTSDSSSSSSSSWECPRCTLINTDRRKMRCKACKLVYLSREYDQCVRNAENDADRGFYID